MPYMCKDECREHGQKTAMKNLKPSIAYLKANLCTTCSESNESIWFLKWKNQCPCCGSALRHKSKHSHGREKVRAFINKKE